MPVPASPNVPSCAASTPAVAMLVPTCAGVAPSETTVTAPAVDDGESNATRIAN
jgi:hypothetical protein